MKSTIIRLGILALMISALAGCGGSNNDAAPAPVPVNSSVITSAAAIAANDTSINSSAPFTVIKDAGISPVTVNSPPKVNFTVFSDGAVKQGLTTSNMSFAIAKLVPGTTGNPDQWVNYIYRTETATTGVGPGGVPAMASAPQATTDSKVATQLVYNADGYYTYTFNKDIKDPTKTNGVVFEPNLTHRVAIQLSYTNKAGETVLVNPYFDFTIDANGNAVAVTDPTKTRKMTTVASCNTCHDKLALHGGGRVDTQYCVMCHNSGTFDANSGNVLDLRTMAHKIHSGRRLAKSATPEDYTIWGYSNTKHDYAEVGFPQDLRNCTKCHSGANASTPQGDNWKSKPTKEACLTCHQTGAGTKWNTTHIDVTGPGTVNALLGSPTSAANTTNAACANCHSATSTWGAEQVHWNQNEENAAKYNVVIDSATYSSTTRKVTVKYHVDDTTNSNAKWDLNTGCTGAVGANGLPACSSTNKFGNLRFIAAYNNILGQPTSVTEFSSYNNNGSSATAYAYTGTNAGNVYTVDITIPADIAGVTEAKGTGRVVTYGQIIEPALDVVTRNPKSPAANINVSAKNTFKDFAISGTLTPRKEIVSNDKCNACHGLLGTASGSNVLNNAFHSGARNTIESCGATCHDAGRAGQYTVMHDDFKFPASVLGGAGVTYTMNESHHLKRMIHGIHGGERKVKNVDGTYKYPFLHGPRVTVDQLVPPENFTAEVVYPGNLANCNTCHVNDSYQSDRGPLGSAVLSWSTDSTTTSTRYNENNALRSLLLTTVGTTDYVDSLKNPVLSPKAASCTACHDSTLALTHVTGMGASFGGKTQGQYLNGQVFEACDGCHAPGAVVGVDVKHGLK